MPEQDPPSPAPATVAVVPARPAAFFMCTETECQERQSSGEISLFESIWPPPEVDNEDNTKTKQNRRIVDTHYAMTKYRRSAAGFDAKHRAPSRSLEQIMCCVSQLEYILCHQQQPPKNSNTMSSFPRQTLSGTVGFVEDRIRAAQVDMVVSQQPSAAIQYRMVKCHILILYLLGKVNAEATSCKYEATFGRQALSAAMTNYWEEPQEHFSRNHSNHDDDILCFMALQQISQYYTDNNGNRSTESLSFILDYYRRNVQVHRQQLKDFPRFQWALQLVHLAIMDRPQSILRQLAELGDSDINSTESNTGLAGSFACSTEFAVLCRCCLAPGVVDTLRFQALEQYNKIYMKGEKVSTKELARLLYFREVIDAEDFAIQMAGLSKLDPDSGGNDENKIVFKLGPVTKSDQLGSGRRQQDDEFVFGVLYNNSYWPFTQFNRKSQSTAWDDVPALSSDTGLPTVNGSAHNTPVYTGARVDMEGVPIPPPDLLYRILVSPSSSK